MRILYLASILVVAACKRGDESAVKTDSDTVISADSVLENPQAADSAAASRTCGVTGAALLTEEGIGELKQGRPVSEVSALCDVISDSQQQGTEGMMERVIVVRLGSETVRAIVTDDRVFRIEVNTPRFRTADSLGVDTPLRRIAVMRGAQFAPGEDGVYGFSPDHCGLSFRFSLPWRPPAGGQWTAAAISRVHGDAAVDRVIVIPCTR